MLKQLTVENYILIPKLELHLASGYTCITGETGAGKSIIIGALQLVLGHRADVSVLREADKKCVVEGTFLIQDYHLQPFFENNELDYDDVTIIRREINPQGKSRAFINDTPVNLSVMRELGEKLVDIHSQHQTLEINNSAFQIRLLDDFSKNNHTLAQYSAAYKKYNQLNNLLSTKEIEEKQSAAEREYLEFQYEELDKAQLVEGEQEEAESELNMLTHAEEIKSNTYIAIQHLSNEDNNAISTLIEVKQLIEQIAKHHEAYTPLFARMQESVIEIKDIYQELDKHYHTLHFDPNRIEELNERLSHLYQLQQKHKVATIAELITLKNTINSKLLSISSLENEISYLKNEISLCENELFRLSDVLHNNRKNVVANIENAMKEKLANLGMPSAVFSVKIEKTAQFTPTGTDMLTFLFSANKGTEPKELSKVASGGELSRLMLALKSLVLSRNLLPTILFDEIDAGVSGEIAAKVGNILQQMAKKMQVITITHLPQIAAKADVHYWVYKTENEFNTVSGMKQLDTDERIEEIARILSDENITEAAKTTAKELLGININ